MSIICRIFFHLNERIFSSLLLQGPDQNPVKHLKWSVLRKQLAVKNRELFSQNATSQMFDRIPNTPTVLHSSYRLWYAISTNLTSHWRNNSCSRGLALDCEIIQNKYKSFILWWITNFSDMGCYCCTLRQKKTSGRC